MFPGGGEVGAAARACSASSTRTGDRCSIGRSNASSVIARAVAFQMTSMLRDVIDRGTGAPARDARRARPGRRQDGHDRRLSRRVVRRLFLVGRRRRVGRFRSAGDRSAREAYGARVALPIWADFMKRTARSLPPARFRRAQRHLHGEELCSVSYLRPVDGCPTYTEYFKERRQVPSALCPIHRGTLKQQARRARSKDFSAASAVRSPAFSAADPTMADRSASSSSTMRSIMRRWWWSFSALSGDVDGAIDGDRGDRTTSALNALTHGHFDVAFFDYWLGARDGVALLREIRRRGIDTPVVVLTSRGAEDVAVEAMKAGAADYLQQDADLSVEALERAIRHALALHDEERQRRQAEEALRASEERFRALVENSSDALLLIDAEGRIRVHVAARRQRHLGWTPERDARPFVFRLSPSGRPRSLPAR